MSMRALSFGAVADAYERFRPEYPAELYDVVATYAGAPIRTALEIGAGTGKATRVFALHWTRADGRWSRVAAHLEPGGVFASFGGSFRITHPEIEQAVRTARAPFLDDDEVPSPDGTAPEAPMRWPGTELQKSSLFSDVQQTDIQRRLTISAHEYVGYLSTVSAYLQLPDVTRQATYAAIAQVLPATVKINADLTAHLARRRLK